MIMQTISENNRRKILDYLLINSISWHGEASPSDFLTDIFDLDNLPSTDSRFKTAHGDIQKHTELNNDWEDDWIFTDQRFNITTCEDETFLSFLVKTIHPTIRPDIEAVNKIVLFYNSVLKSDGYELIKKSDIDTHPVFGWNKRVTARYEGIIQYLVTPHPRYSADRSFHPCVILAEDNWNDYGYVTMFHARYVDEFGNEHPLGDVKILNFENTVTSSVISKNFTQLVQGYVSLGQSPEYYENLYKLGKSIYTKVLNNLNDIVFNSRLITNHEENRGFKISLLRDPSAEKAYAESGKYFEKEYTDFDNTMEFTFESWLPEAASQHTPHFNFKKSQLPYRINALIGKNGTGKTHVIANIANALSGSSNEKEKKTFGIFSPQNPNFSKVIVFSYSVFDKFLIPESDNYTSYRYCGIRTSDGMLSDGEIKQRLIDSLEIVIKKDRRFEWRSALSQIIDVNNIFTSDEKLTIKLIENKYNLLSSGQTILITLLTQAIAFSENESLLLFDEPELHLHPNAIANFIKVLFSVLERFNSYAVISTHSPIILREIPAKYIQVFDREGNIPIIYPLQIESFGENFSTISDEIFGTLESDGNYQSTLEKLIKEIGYDETLKLFDDKLSLNAKIYMKLLNNEEH